MPQKNKQKWLKKCKKKEVHPELAIYKPLKKQNKTNFKDKRLGKYKHKSHTHKTKKAMMKCKK